MENLNTFLRRLGDVHPNTKKATTKALWKKWIDGVKTPTHAQMMRVIDKIAPEIQEIYIEQAFKIMCYHKTHKIKKLSFPVLPMACPRPRFTRFGRTYMPAKYVLWKKNIGAMMEGHDMISTPVEIDFIFHFFSENKSWGVHEQKPDIDNLVKAFLDAATDAGLLKDDNLVHKITARKIWSFEPKIIAFINY